MVGLKLENIRVDAVEIRIDLMSYSNYSNTVYSNTVPSDCHTLIVGEALSNNGKVQETYYKYDTNGNVIETKTLFPTRDYAVFSGTFNETTQTTFEFDLTPSAIAVVWTTEDHPLPEFDWTYIVLPFRYAK